MSYTSNLSNEGKHTGTMFFAGARSFSFFIWNVDKSGTKFRDYGNVAIQEKLIFKLIVQNGRKKS